MPEELQANRQPAEPSQPPPSFRERKQQQLAGEREQTRQPQPDSDDQPDREAVQRQAEEPALEDSIEEQPESADEPEAILEEEDEPDVSESADDADDDEERYSPRERELMREAEEAEKNRKSMEVDYRHKTHKLSQHMRETEGDAEKVQKALEFCAQLAEQHVNQFQNVNWQELQTRPQEYQQAVQQFQAAQAHRQQMVQGMQQSIDYAAKLKERNLSAQAEHSKGVLEHSIPGWSGETYSKVREFATTEYGYDASEFDQIVDWRPVKALHDAMQAQNARKRGAELVKVKAKKRRNNGAPSGRNAEVVSRDAKGRYSRARDEAISNPGNRNAFREMKQRQLAMERDRLRRG